MVIHPREQVLGRPGMCFICEQTPGPETRMINTMRLYVPETPIYLAGVKYLCENCVRTAMVTLGWLLPDEVEKLVIDKETLLDEVDDLEDEIARLRKLNEAITTVAEYVGNK